MAHAGMHFYGRFKNGHPFGHFWVGMLGEGQLHGNFEDTDKADLITGDKISYIYPDGETAFLGRFEDKVMKKAKAVDVKSYSCDEFGLLYVSEYSEPWQDIIYSFDPPTNISFGSNTKEGRIVVNSA